MKLDIYPTRIECVDTDLQDQVFVIETFDEDVAMVNV